MNFKLLAATTLLFTAGTAIPAFSTSEEDIDTLNKRRDCVGCNLSNLKYAASQHSRYLSQRDMKNSNFEGANFSSSILISSDLRNSNLSNTNLQFTSFSKADLRNANLKNANLRGANLCGADLRGVNWKGVIYNKQTECLPDEAIDYVHTARHKNNDSNYNNCPSVNSVSNTNSRSLKENVNEVKDVTESVKDLINLF